MRALLQLFCFAYPREFRKAYCAQIVGDYEERPRRERSAFFAAQLLADIVQSGVRMRADFAARDVAYALRRLWKTPLMTAVIVLTFALGIGANVAVFSVMNAVVLRQLPFPNATRLVAIEQRDPRLGNTAQLEVSQLDLRDMLAEGTTLENAASYGEDAKTLTGMGKPVELNISDVAWRFFPTIGVHPELGRFFSLADTRGANVVVLSDQMWRSRFGGDPHIVGRTVALDGAPYRVIGIAPAGFKTPEPGFGGLFPADAFTVLSENIAPVMRGARYLSAVALIRPGTTVAAVQADLTRVQRLLQQRYPAFENRTTIVAPLREAILGDSTPALLTMIFVGVFGVFLIMCANISSLLLTQANAREHELSMRMALGAARSRIVTQLLTESGVLALAGGIAGVVAAFFALRFFAVLGTRQIPRLDSATIDLPVALYGAAIVVCATLAAGAAPAWMMSLAQGTFARSAGRGSNANRRAQSVLVVAEIAIALALVTASGLALRSFYGLTHANIGIRSDGVVATENFPLAARRFPTIDAKREALRRLGARLDAIPGAKAALAASYPMSGSSIQVGFTSPGRRTVPGSKPAANLDSVSPNFFDVFGIRLRSGRLFTAADRAGSAPVAIVNTAFMRYIRQGESPIGMRFQIPIPNDPSPQKALRTVVGVVNDVRDGPLADVAPEVYVPLEQGVMPWIAAAAYQPAGSTGALRNGMSAAFTAIDPLSEAPPVRSMAEIMRDSASPARLSTALFIALGAIALALALAGIFAVMSYSIAQRFQEFGIRMAIGSPAVGVVRLAFRSAAILLALGIAIGIVLAAVAGRALAGQLYRVAPADPAVLASVTALIALTAAAAALIPALRAARIDPAAALRYE